MKKTSQERIDISKEHKSEYIIKKKPLTYLLSRNSVKTIMVSQNVDKFV